MDQIHTDLSNIFNALALSQFTIIALLLAILTQLESIKKKLDGGS